MFCGCSRQLSRRCHRREAQQCALLDDIFGLQMSRSQVRLKLPQLCELRGRLCPLPGCARLRGLKLAP
jgi:hypothetical protein